MATKTNEQAREQVKEQTTNEQSVKEENKLEQTTNEQSTNEQAESSFGKVYLPEIQAYNLIH